MKALHLLVLGLLCGCRAPGPVTQSPGPMVCPAAALDANSCGTSANLRWHPSNRPPSYPRQFLDAGIPGSAEVEFAVLRSGQVDTASFHIVSASHRVFSDALFAAVRHWRFGMPGSAGNTTLIRFRAQFRMRCGGDPCVESAAWTVGPRLPEVTILAAVPPLVARDAVTCSSNGRCGQSSAQGSAPLTSGSVASAAIAAVLDAGRENGVSTSTAEAWLCTPLARRGLPDSSIVALGEMNVPTAIVVGECETPPPAASAGAAILLVWYPDQPASGAWWGQEYSGLVEELHGPNSCGFHQPIFLDPGVDCAAGFRQRWQVVVADSEGTFRARPPQPRVD